MTCMILGAGTVLLTFSRPLVRRRISDARFLDQARGGSTTPEAAIDTLYSVRPSYTDIGFTYVQPVVWDLYWRAAQQTIDRCASDADHDGLRCHCWAVGTIGPLLGWIENAPVARRRLLADHAGLARLRLRCST